MRKIFLSGWNIKILNRDLLGKLSSIFRVLGKDVVVVVKALVVSFFHWRCMSLPVIMERWLYQQVVAELFWLSLKGGPLSLVQWECLCQESSHRGSSPPFSFFSLSFSSARFSFSGAIDQRGEVPRTNGGRKAEKTRSKSGSSVWKRSVTALCFLKAMATTSRRSLRRPSADLASK